MLKVAEDSICLLLCWQEAVKTDWLSQTRASRVSHPLGDGRAKTAHDREKQTEAGQGPGGVGVRICMGIRGPDFLRRRNHQQGLKPGNEWAQERVSRQENYT